MDSLIFFYQEYKKVGFLRLFKDAYINPVRTNWFLIVYSAIVLVILGYLTFQERNIFFWSGFILIFAWAYFLWRSIKISYMSLTEGHENKLKLYSKERQHLRYLIFKNNVMNSNSINEVSVDDALTHLNLELETESANPISSSYYLALIVSLIAALIGSLSSKWGTQSISIILFLLTLLFLLSVTIIGSLRGRKSKLLELKRFLVWLHNDEQP